MSEEVTWVMEVSLPPERREELQALMEEMTTATRAEEPGCGLYDFYVSEDGTTCHILESYIDDAALLNHINRFNRNFARRMFGIVTPTKMTVYGPASDAAREALAVLKPLYFNRL